MKGGLVDRRVSNGHGGGADMCEDWRCDLRYTGSSTLRCSGYCNGKTEAEASLDDLTLGISQDGLDLVLMATSESEENERMFEKELGLLTRHRTALSESFAKAPADTTETVRNLWNEIEVIDATAAQLEALGRRIEARGWSKEPPKMPEYQLELVDMEPHKRQTKLVEMSGSFL